MTTATLPSLDTSVEVAYRDPDGDICAASVDARIIAPGLALTAATNGVRGGMWLTVPGLYTLVHVPSMTSLVGDRATPNQALRWCGECVGEALALVAGGDWAREAHELVADGQVRAAVDQLHALGSCRCGVSDGH